MHRLFIISLALMMSACSQRYISSDDLSYAYNLPPVGSTLILKQTLTVPAGETRIFIQGGKPMRKSEFDRYEASCNFEVRKLQDRPREIEADNFIITQVQRLMEEVVQRQTPASGLQTVEFDYGGKPMVVHGYHLWLGSDRQPDVMRMTCRGYFNDINRAVPPSLEDVRQALGEIAELSLAI